MFWMDDAANHHMTSISPGVTVGLARRDRIPTAERPAPASDELVKLIARDVLPVPASPHEEKAEGFSSQPGANIPAALAELLVQYLSNELEAIET